MKIWVAVITASLAGFALKWVGYVVPARWLNSPRITAATALVPVALLSALVAVQTFTGEGGRLEIDARAIGLAAAALLLWRKANFLVVIVVAAAVTAAARALGMS